MKLSDWQPCERPGQWPLQGTRVVLEPLDWGLHADGLFRAVAGPDNIELWDYMPIGPFSREEDFCRVFEAVRTNQAWETLVIKRLRDGCALGMASYMRIREAHGSAEVGCVAFGDELKRSVEATEAMSLMAHHVFVELGYRRYEWKCHDQNTASKRAAARLGFAFEGVFRNDMVVNGKNRDTAWFAMTNEDWPNIGAGFEDWLDAGNFDTEGGQKQSLKALRA